MDTNGTAPTMAFFRPGVESAGVPAGLAAVGGILGLAHAVAGSAAWSDLGGAAIVVREAPEPLIGVVGRFDEAALARLSVLTWQVEHVLPRTMVLDYAAVERAVSRLAHVLHARFGRRACASFRYEALPRGGFVVLGLLAYALGLDQAQLTPGGLDPGGRRAALVVVDDCMLSGNRLRRYLAATPTPAPVVAASLFAAPELRSAAERDARVRAVVSAYDLRDAAERRAGAAYQAWQEAWRHRNEGGYWIGQPQHVVFPWNEPDIGFWNSTTARVERMWRLVAPERCAKNRPAVGEAPPVVQEQPVGSGPWRPSSSVLMARFDGRHVLGAPHWRGCVTLQGTAAAMWDALVEHGSPDAAAAALARTYDVEPRRLRTDLEDFATALLERGALERTPS